jgi:hypothetical protein
MTDSLSSNRHLVVVFYYMLSLFIPSKRGTLQKAVVAGSLATVALLNPLHTEATHSNQQAEQAAREIQDARDRANAASQAMFDSESQVDTLTIEIADAESELLAVEAKADLMRAQLEEAALRSFVNSGSPTFALLIDLEAANDNLTGDRQAAVAHGNAAVDLDEFEAVMHEVHDGLEMADSGSRCQPGHRISTLSSPRSCRRQGRLRIQTSRRR